MPALIATHWSNSLFKIESGGELMVKSLNLTGGGMTANTTGVYLINSYHDGSFHEIFMQSGSKFLSLVQNEIMVIAWQVMMTSWKHVKKHDQYIYFSINTLFAYNFGYNIIYLFSPEVAFAHS